MAKDLERAALAVAAASVVTVVAVAAWRDASPRDVEDRPPFGEEQLVVVAATDLMPGVPIEEDDVVGVITPRDFFPAGAITEPGLVVGRVPYERILANEPVRPDRLADPEHGVGLSALVPEGNVAVSLLLAGPPVARPGDRVDVRVTLEGGAPITLMRLRPVLAASSAGVTLAVLPEGAEQLHHAQRVGEITLALSEGSALEQPIYDVIPPVQPAPHAIDGPRRR